MGTPAIIEEEDDRVSERVQSLVLEATEILLRVVKNG